MDEFRELGLNLSLGDLGDDDMQDGIGAASTPNPPSAVDGECASVSVSACSTSKSSDVCGKSKFE